MGRAFAMLPVNAEDVARHQQDGGGERISANARGGPGQERPGGDWLGDAEWGPLQNAARRG